ncbi:MAG: manganese efflux pump MntP family protein [Ignavibacteria bacterium]|jgi:putative Mn2+ efflux pump MntP
MGFIEILFISVGLAMDAFAVSICAGTNELTRGKRPTFRLSFHFGLFQFLMPVIGWFLGTGVYKYIEAYDHWIVFGLLSFVGIKMIKSGFDKNSDLNKGDMSKGINLIILSFATSVDAFAIGISFAMLQTGIWFPSLIIGIVTAVLSVIGVQLGNILGNKFGKKMEILGGIILILIGVRIFIEHIAI